MRRSITFTVASVVGVLASAGYVLGQEPESGHWMDYIKFGGTKPSYDVIKKTEEYTSLPGYRSFNLSDIPSSYYSDEYIFRGPVVGPINRTELVRTNTNFNLGKSFSDLDRKPFGFTVDPENPYRVLYFERWTATNDGSLDISGVPSKKPTGKKVKSPAFPFSLVWNPDGKIIFEHLSGAVNRFEGNTNGKVAVYSLLEAAGISQDNTPGNWFLILQQKAIRFFNSPTQVYSRREDIPSWWKSTAVGAELNDELTCVSYTLFPLFLLVCDRYQRLTFTIGTAVASTDVSKLLLCLLWLVTVMETGNRSRSAK